jgi:hypothetical protein
MGFYIIISNLRVYEDIKKTILCTNVSHLGVYELLLIRAITIFYFDPTHILLIKTLCIII